MAIKILPGMNLLDAAVVSSGSAEDLFAFALLNKVPFTFDVTPGDIMRTTGYKYADSSMPNYDHIVTKAVPVLSGQTLADIAIQQSGSLEGLFALAKLNGLGFSDDLMPGQLLDYSLTPISKQVVKIYADNGYKPASGATVPGQQPPPQLAGIDYWIIQNDFIVS